MDYGAIIKRSWHITWRYKALWVLGIFAGVSGCRGGGSSGSGGGNRGSGASDKSAEEFFRSMQGRGLIAEMQRWLPALIALTVVLFVVWLFWSVLGVAARGGLVVGVNDIEQGRDPSLNGLWSAGFGSFWKLVGLELLLTLPVLFVSALVLVAIIVPLWGTIAGGGTPGAEVLPPICGAVAIGVPLLVVLSFIAEVVRLLGTRYVMLGGKGAIDAAVSGWGFLRVRFKDTFVMYLINAGLNIVSSLVLAVPMFVVIFAAALPAIAAAATGNTELAIAPAAIGVVVVIALSMAYSGIWGTYTSALWTLFFRQAAGMDLPLGSPATGPTTTPSTAPAAYPPAPPAAPAVYPPAPPAAPAEYPPQEPPPGPPVAPYEPPA